MRINKNFTIDGWKPEEHTDKMISFHNNEVSPRIKRHIDTKSINWFEQYKEAVLLGSDLYKMKACGVINHIQARKYLDEYIGKLHAYN